MSGSGRLAEAPDALLHPGVRHGKKESMDTYAEKRHQMVETQIVARDIVILP